MNQSELGYLAALAMGFLGSAHCVVMCGGIVGALSQGSPSPSMGRLGRGDPRGIARSLLHQLTLSAGRIATYGGFGLVAGAGGMILGELLGPLGARSIRVAFGLLMVGVGLYLAGWWAGIARIETAGLGIWRRVSPLLATLQPADRAWKRFAQGAIWGWLPCGLVYAALAGAATSGSARRGALYMICFGAGTLPALLATGLVAERVTGLARSRSTRVVAGVFLIAFGLWTVGGALMPHHPGHGEAPQHHHEHSAPSGR